MAGHMGAAKVTVQNLSIYSVDNERGLIFIHGAVPGHKVAGSRYVMQLKSSQILNYQHRVAS